MACACLNRITSGARVWSQRRGYHRDVCVLPCVHTICLDISLRVNRFWLSFLLASGICILIAENTFRLNGICITCLRSPSAAVHVTQRAKLGLPEVSRTVVPDG